MSISVRDVGYSYRKQEVLQNLTFAFEQGVLGLLGPNGAGKTTLLRLLATATVPTRGSICLFGHDSHDRSAHAEIRRRLGYLPQSFGYFPQFSVGEFVEYFALLKGVPSAQAAAATTVALEAVNLEAVRQQKLKALSGGMLRRAGIAQALVNRPDLLLLDEPTVGLDPSQRLAFRALLRSCGERSTVVVSTHLVEDVAAACTHVIVLSGGAIAFSGTPEALAHRGTADEPGDTPLERGYSAVIRESHVARW